MNDIRVKELNALIRKTRNVSKDQDPESRIQVLGMALTLEFLNQFEFEAIDKFKRFAENSVKVMDTMITSKRRVNRTW